MKKLYIGILGLLGLVSCSNEAPFESEYAKGTGRVLTSALSVEVKNQTPTARAAENGVPEAKDFQVDFYLTSDEENAVSHYDSYGMMPEIVVLPAGEYIVKVTYGGEYGASNVNAAFEKPYYEGKSDKFTVEVDKIVDTIEPIICELANIRVKIVFDQSLTNDSNNRNMNVAVHVGGSGTILNYTPATTQDGYFAYATGSTTLAATFTGIVEEENVSVTKSIQGVQPGNYYIITFSLRSADAADPGNIDPGNSGDFKIDASVIYKDLNDDESYDDDSNWQDGNEYLDDDLRPENGETNKPGEDDPSTGDDEPNGDDEPGEDNPGEGQDNENSTLKVTVTPEGQIQLGENGSNKYSEMPTCELKVTSETGLTEFKIQIHSLEDPDMDKTLQQVFGEYIDLVNDPQNGAWEMLAGLDPPVQTDLGGEHEVSVTLSNFFPFVAGAFPDNHHTIFKIFIGDETRSETIILNVEF